MKFHPVPESSQPSAIASAYGSTLRRGPRHAPVAVPCAAATDAGVRFAGSAVPAGACDLTNQGADEPIGQRIVVTGRVVDEDGRPVPRSLIEIWQCNAAGRYTHANDQHRAPLDPNFSGEGRMLTDDDGRYRFITIRPGAYPWNNHHNAWRPAHIHFSLFGNVYAQRLVTQMYFPDDPLIPFDAIINTISDEAARRTLVSRFSMEETISDEALGFVYDIVLRGRDATPFGL
ncbi:protocatechuate 3,4-dioxygenase subunit beta [Variovorax sp. RHLX14]|uniref:protocatechuate 3,4-dioxygenase subunit beta n=1 Tax=Variovorax sp. RHLX14 TaxID=1259731 RepID=UPI003F448190